MSSSCEILLNFLKSYKTTPQPPHPLEIIFIDKVILNESAQLLIVVMKQRKESHCKVLHKSLRKENPKKSRKTQKFSFSPILCNSGKKTFPSSYRLKCQG